MADGREAGEGAAKAGVPAAAAMALRGPVVPASVGVQAGFGSFGFVRSVLGHAWNPNLD